MLKAISLEGFGLRSNPELHKEIFLIALYSRGLLCRYTPRNDARRSSLL
jgi:hypothetical protein